MGDPSDIEAVLTSAIDGKVRHVEDIVGLPLCGARGRFVSLSVPWWGNNERLAGRPVCRRCMAKAPLSGSQEADRGSAPTRESYRHNECSYLAPLVLLRDGTRVWFCNKCGGGGADIDTSRVVSEASLPGSQEADRG